MPENWKPVFFNERYQSAGMIKHIPAETVLMGTSMVANIRPSAAAEAFHSTALRITIPDGYFSEFDQAADLLFRTQDPKRLVFCLDMSTLIRDPSGVTGAMPACLYDRNPFNDAEYLLNKDTLYYSLSIFAYSRHIFARTRIDADNFALFYEHRNLNCRTRFHNGILQRIGCRITLDARFTFGNFKLNKVFGFNRESSTFKEFNGDRIVLFMYLSASSTCPRLSVIISNVSGSIK